MRRKRSFESLVEMTRKAERNELLSDLNVGRSGIGFTYKADGRRYRFSESNRDEGFGFMKCTYGELLGKFVAAANKAVADGVIVKYSISNGIVKIVTEEDGGNVFTHEAVLSKAIEILKTAYSYKFFPNVMLAISEGGENDN